MPAILPSGPYAHVNPLFRAAPSAPFPHRLACLEISAHMLREEKQFFIPGSGDFQQSNCNRGENCARTCRAPPALPFVVSMAG